MNNQEPRIIFRDMLGDLKELALSRGNEISRAEVEAFLNRPGLEGVLSGEHLDMICEYLRSQRIRVTVSDSSAASTDEDTAPAAETGPETGRDGETKTTAGTDAEADVRPPMSQSLETYLQDLDQLFRPEAGEELELFRRAVKGDAAAKEALTHAYLETVCSLAAEYEGEEILMEDLIQEGNIGLLLALEHLEEKETLAAYRVSLLNEINRALEDAIEAHRDEHSRSEETLRRVRRLDEAAQSLMEELGRKVTPEELSAFLGIPEEEIREIAALAGDELGIEMPGQEEKKPWEI